MGRIRVDRDVTGLKQNHPGQGIFTPLELWALNDPEVQFLDDPVTQLVQVFIEFFGARGGHDPVEQEVTTGESS